MYIYISIIHTYIDTHVCACMHTYILPHTYVWSEIYVSAYVYVFECVSAVTVRCWFHGLFLHRHRAVLRVETNTQPPSQARYNPGDVSGWMEGLGLMYTSTQIHKTPNPKLLLSCRFFRPRLSGPPHSSAQAAAKIRRQELGFKVHASGLRLSVRDSGRGSAKLGCYQLQAYRKNGETDWQNPGAHSQTHVWVRIYIYKYISK